MAMHVGVTIDSGPNAWQVLQQDESGCAGIELSGRWAPQAAGDTESGPHWVEVRLVYESSACPVSSALDWTPAEMGPDGSWQKALQDVPAGGLYRVETRVCRRGLPDERPLRGDYVHCLGVGDLWCIAGQSNAAGTGSGIVEDRPELGVHLFGNDEQWKLATHPLEDATRTRHPVTITGIHHGHSPWLAFAKCLKQRLGLPIGLIPTALGGSPLQRWNPQEPGEADLYENMMDMIRKTGGQIRGIVWYQGESDCNPASSRSYGARFRQFVEQVRSDLQAPDLPVITAQLNRSTTSSLRVSPAPGGELPPDTQRAWSAVREAQRQAANEIPFVYLVPTLDLSLSDTIHTSSPSEVLLGERFAQVALGKVYGTKALDDFAELVEAGFTGPEGRDIAARFQNIAGGWLAIGLVEDFQVEDENGWVPIEDVALGEDGEVRIRLSRAAKGTAWLHMAYGADPLVRLRDSNRRPVVAFSVEVAGPSM